MTEVMQHAPADRYGEQLELDVFETGTAADVVVPVDVMVEVVESPAYLELRAQRDEAEGRHRSGARAIARGAFAALQAGEITHDEFERLFPIREVPAPREPELLADRPPRELDWAERAAGEGVRRPYDDLN
ncbi:MAG TPA: hypothetical protein VJM46_00435 [Candidatus Saccharimonadales bacterium]|nr:hypothetical protein [Candidatus Saccharimonadales bacterium]